MNPTSTRPLPAEALGVPQRPKSFVTHDVSPNRRRVERYRTSTSTSTSTSTNRSTNRSGRAGAAGCLAFVLLLGACGGSSGSSSGGSKRTGGSNGVSAGDGGPDELFAESASFETVAGRPQRVMVGLSTKDQRVLAGGEVTFVLRSVADDTAAPLTLKAAYLSVAGMPAVTGEARIGRPSRGTGVYTAIASIPAAGVWTIDITPIGRSNKNHAQTAVEVLTKNQVPDVGDLAPATKNMTLTTPGVQQQWLDSSADAEAPADPLLHSTVIADALAQKQPLVIVVSTLVYCESRFCGPVTEVIRKHAEQDAGRADAPKYVHLEVWRDFEKRVVNKAAAEWILPNEAQGREPWVFVVGRDNRIIARFDNVIDEAALDRAIATARK